MGAICPECDIEWVEHPNRITYLNHMRNVHGIYLEPTRDSNGNIIASAEAVPLTLGQAEEPEPAPQDTPQGKTTFSPATQNPNKD